MRYIKKFESFPGENIKATIKNSNILTNDYVRNSEVEKTFYDTSWEELLPKMMKINYRGKIYSFEKGNIMLLNDMIEITYDSHPANPWGCPDTLEFDVYLVQNQNNSNNKLRVTVDITYGDLMVCEFTIESPNKVNIVQYTSYHSKFDPSNTVFALEDESLDSFINFLNRLDGINLNRKDMKFLDKIDNYIPELFPDDIDDTQNQNGTLSKE
jgi:hypothetical protein